jgi:hypothetical protein
VLEADEGEHDGVEEDPGAVGHVPASVSRHSLGRQLGGFFTACNTASPTSTDAECTQPSLSAP